MKEEKEEEKEEEKKKKKNKFHALISKERLGRLMKIL